MLRNSNFRKVLCGKFKEILQSENILMIIIAKKEVKFEAVQRRYYLCL